MPEWAVHSRMRADTRWMLRRVTLAVEGGLLMLAIALGLLSGTYFWAGASIHAGALLLGAAAGLLLLGAVIVVLEIPSRFSAAIGRDVDPMMGIFRRATRLDLIAISVLAGAGEEAFFRGFLQQALAGLSGDIIAILAVSALFGLAHFLSPAYVVFATMLSIPLGVLYAQSGNIVVPMVAHAVYDYVALNYGLHRWNGRRSPA